MKFAQNGLPSPREPSEANLMSPNQGASRTLSNNVHKKDEIWKLTGASDREIFLHFQIPDVTKREKNEIFG